MSLSQILLNPNSINTIDPVDEIALTPPTTGVTNGYRVLVASPDTGTSNSVTGASVFAGNEGKIAIKTATGWTFENEDEYLDDQLLLLKKTNGIWVYSKADKQFNSAGYDPAVAANPPAPSKDYPSIWQGYNLSTTTNATDHTPSNSRLLTNGDYIPIAHKLIVNGDNGTNNNRHVIPGDGSSINTQFRLRVGGPPTTPEYDLNVRHQTPLFNGKPSKLAICWVKESAFNPTGVPSPPIYVDPGDLVKVDMNMPTDLRGGSWTPTIFVNPNKKIGGFPTNGRYVQLVSPSGVKYEVTTRLEGLGASIEATYPADTDYGPVEKLVFPTINNPEAGEWKLVTTTTPANAATYTDGGKIFGNGEVSKDTLINTGAVVYTGPYFLNQGTQNTGDLKDANWTIGTAVQPRKDVVLTSVTGASFQLISPSNVRTNLNSFTKLAAASATFLGLAPTTNHGEAYNITHTSKTNPDRGSWRIVTTNVAANQAKLADGTPVPANETVLTYNVTNSTMTAAQKVAYWQTLAAANGTVQGSNGGTICNRNSSFVLLSKTGASSTDIRRFPAINGSSFAIEYGSALFENPNGPTAIGGTKITACSDLMIRPWKEPNEYGGIIRNGVPQSLTLQAVNIYKRTDANDDGIEVGYYYYGSNVLASRQNTPVSASSVAVYPVSKMNYCWHRVSWSTNSTAVSSQAGPAIKMKAGTQMDLLLFAYAPDPRF